MTPHTTVAGFDVVENQDLIMEVEAPGEAPLSQDVDYGVEPSDLIGSDDDDVASLASSKQSQSWGGGDIIVIRG